MDDRGRIADVGPENAVAAPRGTARDDFDQAIIIPGLINCHTHLELGFLRGAAGPNDFFEWIQWVRASKESAGSEASLEAARSGLQETWSKGATFVADTGTTGAAVSALSDLGGRGIYYQEAIAPEPDRAADVMNSSRDAVRRLRSVAAPGITIGISPHAPYTVSPELYRRAVSWARDEKMPIATHLAESAEETELLVAGEGPFARMWRERGIPGPEPARSPVEYLHRLRVLGPDVLAIHAARVDERDIQIMRETGTAVASCPRSNERHGHELPPLAGFLAAGLRVGLGTDSLGSVESLNLFQEGRAAARICDAAPELVVRLLTADAAGALGVGSTAGTIERGKWADFCVIRPNSLPEPDAHAVARAILDAAPGSVVATYVGGRRVHYSSAS